MAFPGCPPCLRARLAAPARCLPRCPESAQCPKTIIEHHSGVCAQEPLHSFPLSQSSFGGHSRGCAAQAGQQGVPHQAPAWAEAAGELAAHAAGGPGRWPRPELPWPPTPVSLRKLDQRDPLALLGGPADPATLHPCNLDLNLNLPQKLPIVGTLSGLASSINTSSFVTCMGQKSGCEQQM